MTVHINISKQGAPYRVRVEVQDELADGSWATGEVLWLEANDGLDKTITKAIWKNRGRRLLITESDE